MIERFIADELVSLLEYYPAVGLIGPRQVGKTTLAGSLNGVLPKKMRYFDLERLEDFRLLESDPGFFLGQYEDECIVIDEVQRMPGLFAELRSLIDRKREAGRFLLLGSASPLLMRQTADSLAGRIAYLTLRPLHLTEVVYATTENLRGHWWRGGFPDSWLATTDARSAEWREQFVRTYVERDLSLLGLNADTQRFRMFLQIIAAAQGSLWNAESVGRSLGLSGATIRHYLGFLETSFFVLALRPFFVNISKRLVKSPKVYIADTGLLHALAGIKRPDELLVHPLAGASWEGYVLMQIITKLPADVEPYFYRTSDGTECDLVLVRGLTPIASIEVILGNAVNISRSLRSVADTLGTVHNFIITYSSEPQRLSPTVTAMGVVHFVDGGFLDGLLTP